jgi:hypothetical protein
MRSIFAALALAGMTAAVSLTAAPYREPVWPTQVVNRFVKEQSRLPQGSIIPRVVKTVSYRLSAMPLSKPKPERRPHLR